MEPPVNAKAALLQALIRGEGYGLELIERVRTRTKGEVNLHQGNTYPALRELEKEGFVKAWDADPTPERGGRPRRYYKLTAAGQRAALEQKQAIASLFDLVPAGARWNVRVEGQCSTAFVPSCRPTSVRFSNL